MLSTFNTFHATRASLPSHLSCFKNFVNEIWKVSYVGNHKTFEIGPFWTKLWQFSCKKLGFFANSQSNMVILLIFFTKMAIREAFKKQQQALQRFLWAAQLKFDFDADKLLMNCKLTMCKLFAHRQKHFQLHF